jgi:signal transduction histidine kinase
MIAASGLERAVADALDLAVWLADAEGRFLYCNAAARELAPEAESLADLGRFLVAVPLGDLVHQVRAGRAESLPAALMNTNGRVRQVELRLAQGPEAVPGSLLLTVSEIRWRLLPEWVQAMSEMSSALNHHVNNPLAILSGEVELLGRERTAAPLRIQRMRIAVRRIADVIGRLRRAAEAMGATGAQGLGTGAISQSLGPEPGSERQAP